MVLEQYIILDMGNLLNTRRGLISRPYTAELEYLACTTTQYINTGITADPTYDFEIECLSEVIGTEGVFGARSGTSGRGHSLIFPSQGHVRYSYGNNVGDGYSVKITNLAVNQWVNYKSVDGKSLYVDGVLIGSTSYSTYSALNLTYYLFTSNTNGSAGTIKAKRIRKFVLYDANDYEIMHLIPVRVGSDGYMYDKITGSFFSNSGTGTFILGPDVGSTKPYDSEVEYIRSTGTQYFDMGLKLTNNNEVEMSYYSTDKSSNIFGAREGADSKNFMGSVGSSTNNVYIDFNDSDYSLYRAQVGSSFTSNKIKVIVNKDFRGVYDIAGKVAKKTNTTVCNDVFTCSTNAYILAASGSPYFSAKLKCDFYNCKVRDGGVLIRNFIPVRIGTTGYLYDKVSGQMYSNQGTGDFVLGTDVSDLSNVYEVEYLQSSGTQWIDLEVPLKVSGFKYSIKFEVLDPSVTTLIFSGRAYTDSTKSGSLSLFIVSSNFRTDYFGTSTVTSLQALQNILYEINYSNGITNINGIDYTTPQGSGVLSAETVYLFGGHRTGVSGLEYSASIKLYYAKIWQDNQVVFDLIPVRIGQVGYLYNRVTGELFSNSGTGDFTYGNDIKQII